MIHLSKKQSIFILVPSIVIFLFIIIILYISIFPNSAGNFADDVLRPIIGSDRVLYLESVLFNTEDVFNRIKYSYVKPAAPQFNDVVSLTPTPVAITPTPYQIALDPITSPSYFPVLPGEGEWKQVNFSLFPNQLVGATTFIRPDPTRPYAIVDILKMDMTKLRMGLVAGTKHPGGDLGNYGPGIVPKNIQDANALVAAFSGGFQYKDGHYGMIVEDKTYVPLVKNAATLVIHKSGQIEIVNYTGQDLGSDVIGVRQNCPMLISNGQVTADTAKGEATWGWTDIPSNTYVIRTGIGITANGDLLFAVGKSLTPKTLGDALQAAGAINAMQLDINPSWTRFIIYTSLDDGKYSYVSYDKSLVNGGAAYLKGWYKDFIYLYKPLQKGE